MRLLAFFVYGILALFMLLFFMRIGMQFMFILLRFWYITLPVLIAIYLIFPKSKTNTNQPARTDLDPSKEIKLDNEPHVKDLDSKRDKENRGDNI